MKPSLAHQLFAIGLAAFLLESCTTARGRSQALVDSASSAQAGQMLFEKRCAGCHGLDHAKEGPPLRTVYGRKAGSVPGFDYSDGLKNSHIVWDESSLNQWLTNTESLVRDNNMDFAVPKPDERAEIIQYLKETSGK